MIFAGPAANLLLAVLLFALLFMAASGSYRLGFALTESDNEVTAIVDDVLDGAPAESIGVRPGDRIVAINGRPVAAEQISLTIRASDGQPLQLTVERGESG